MKDLRLFGGREFLAGGGVVQDTPGKGVHIAMAEADGG